MRRLQKYLALAPAGRAIVRRSLLLLPFVALLLRTRGMARTQAWLGHLGSRAPDDPGALAPREIARLVNAAASFLGIQCLPRSLLLQHLLRNRGIPTAIRLGVSKLAEGKLDAHAWVELDGLPLNDSIDVRRHYAALPACATDIPVDRA